MTQQTNNELEKLSHELEKIGLNKERLLHDEQTSDDRWVEESSKCLLSLGVSLTMLLSMSKPQRFYIIMNFSLCKPLPLAICVGCSPIKHSFTSFFHLYYFLEIGLQPKKGYGGVIEVHVQ